MSIELPRGELYLKVIDAFGNQVPRVIAIDEQGGFIVQHIDIDEEGFLKSFKPLRTYGTYHKDVQSIVSG